jgi:23S rRNA (guanosine2251-2'-O)-methyltransferase
MKNIAKNHKSYYMYGKHPVLAALANSNRTIENIFCSQENFNANRALIIKYKYQIVSTDFLNNLLGKDQTHQGIVAKVRWIFSDNLGDIDINKPNSRIVILDQITDPQNIGAIIRSAASFKIDAIIIPTDNSPVENATIAKTASGTLELIKIIKVINLKSTMEYLKKHGFWIIGLDGAAKESISAQLFSEKIAIVLGSEDKGLRRLTKETCDYIAKIPMSSKVESLNVANAAAIVFYLSYIKQG